MKASLKNRVRLGIAALWVTVVVLIGVVGMAVASLGQSVTRIGGHELKLLLLARENQELFQSASQALKVAASVGDPTVFDEVDSSFARIKQNILALSSDEKKMLPMDDGQVLALLEAYQTDGGEYLAAASESSLDAMNLEAADKLRLSGVALQSVFDDLSGRVNNRFQDELAGLAKKSVEILLLVCGVVALFAIAIAVLLKRFAARLIERISTLTNHFVETHLDKISMLPSDPHEDELADLREVSNRMLSSMQLSKKELVGFQFVKDVFDSLRDSVCVVDENDRAIIQFNPSFLRMLEATGVHCQTGDSLHGVLAQCGFVIDFEALLGAGASTQGIEIEVGNEEASRSYLVSSWRTQLNGRNVILVAFADITALSSIKKEKHEIELQLMHASKLTSLGTMGAGLAHELNNPLASIIGFTSVLLKEGLSRERQVEALEKIQRNADRMNRVISHMRAFARDSRTTEKQACKIDGPIQSAFMVLETELSVNSIVTDIALPERELVFMGSSTEIESVIQNLISNSRDAFLGQVELPQGVVRRISLGVEQCGKDIVLRFRDNAGGIPLAIRDRIFEPFFTTKDVGKGTGIGLSLSYRFMQDHGGSIACDCPLPGVTEFEIRLPLLESRERISAPDHLFGLGNAGSDFDRPLCDSGSGLGPSQVPLAQSRSDSKTQSRIDNERQRPRIAWIDDEVNILELVSEILEDRFELETFSDPELAVEHVLQNPPDLVVTDIRMPKKSGFQVVALVRSHFKDLPILVASGHASNDRDALEIHTAGAQGLIPKPFPTESVLFESISFFLHAKTKPVVFVISCVETHRYLIESNLFGAFTLRYYGSAAAAEPKFLLEFPRFIIFSEDCIGSLEKLVRFRDSSLPNAKLICIASMKGAESAVSDIGKYEVVEVPATAALACSKIAEILCQSSGFQTAESLGHSADEKQHSRE